jgi:hypothetical protein
LDSSTKIPEGVLRSTFLHIGDFDECMEVKVQEEWGSFKGQHCMVEVNVKLPGNKNEVRRIPAARYIYCETFIMLAIYTSKNQCARSLHTK